AETLSEIRFAPAPDEDGRETNFIFSVHAVSRIEVIGRVDEFLISCTSGTGSILFFDRQPVDRNAPIEEFSVRVTARQLTAAARVYVGHARLIPVQFFADMARQWSGWRGELVWESLESELQLRSSFDRCGHVSIYIRLRRGWKPEWEIQSTEMT